MKKANSLGNIQIRNDYEFGPPAMLETVKTACLDALHAVDQAGRKCIRAGQLLNEWKERLPHGDFMETVQFAVPGISHETVNIWMRAAANVARALPAPPAFEIESETIPVSEILSLPDDELPEAAREWKQLWLDFTNKKTIKECLEAVVVYGDPAHRADRAINGATKGGAGGDRKDYPLFVGVKLKDMGGHLKHWNGMNSLQRNTVQQVIRASILGEEVRVGKRLFKYEVWPEEVCRLAIEALKERLKR